MDLLQKYLPLTHGGRSEKVTYREARKTCPEQHRREHEV